MSVLGVWAVNVQCPAILCTDKKKHENFLQFQLSMNRNDFSQSWKSKNILQRNSRAWGESIWILYRVCITDIRELQIRAHIPIKQEFLCSAFIREFHFLVVSWFRLCEEHFFQIIIAVDLFRIENFSSDFWDFWLQNFSAIFFYFSSAFCFVRKSAIYLHYER